MAEGESAVGSPSQKADVLRLLREVGIAAAAIEKSSQETARSARFMRDVAAPIQDALQLMPPDGMLGQAWEDLRVALTEYLEVAKRILPTPDAMLSFSVASSSASGTTNTAMWWVMSAIVPSHNT